MKQIVFIFCLFTTFTWSQTAPAKKGAGEWDQLDKTFISLIEALTKANEANFIALSAKQIECTECAEAGTYTGAGYYVDPYDFYDGISKSFTKSAIFKALSSRGYGFSAVTLKGLKVPYLPAATAKGLKVYDVWIDTYLPGEVSKGHPGTRHTFRFIKTGNKFVFFGLAST
ncbi:hypothetical protein ACLI09_04720 [Flavobacterium sp. RHBU_24]|uniref:hypothetical protein n=1 Tax=Flavobacterium sp. RHBU_24 TaxID=3391185 RepID=UPI0039851021